MRQTTAPCRRAILDPAGNITGWEICRPIPKPSGIRGGEQYGVWNDLVQAWEIGPVSLHAAIRALYYQEVEGDIMFYAGPYMPVNLTRAEMQQVREGMDS